MVGHVSGGHINPAVSIAMAVVRAISPARAVLYTVFQCCGAVVGSLLLKAYVLHYLNVTHTVCNYWTLNSTTFTYSKRYTYIYLTFTAKYVLGNENFLWENMTRSYSAGLTEIKATEYDGIWCKFISSLLISYSLKRHVYLYWPHIHTHTCNGRV